MKFKVLIFTLSALLLSGCTSFQSGIKTGADVGLAYASFGDCREEWENWVPADVRLAVADQVSLLDGHIASLNAVTQRDPDITFTEAAAKIVNGGQIKSQIESGFAAIESNAIDYALEIGAENQELIGCSNTIKSAWSGVFESDGGVKVVEVLSALAPYAKYLPLLL